MQNLHPPLSLVEHFQHLPDPRVRRTRHHELIDILIVARCTLLCGGRSFNDRAAFGKAKLAWFKTFLTLTHGIPSHDTFNRVFAALLRALELSGCLVTLDAMGCQRAIAQEIKEADADYVLALKGNHETVHEEVKTFLDAAVQERTLPRLPGAKLSPAAAGLAGHETVEKDHGRIEIRRFYLSTELDWFADRHRWEGLQAVGMVESLRRIGRQTTVERRYYLASVTEIQSFARAVRGHWGVENKVHWLMDVVFGEDQSRARAGDAAENLATLRRLALNLLKRDTARQRSLRGQQLDASWNQAYLLQ